MESYLPSVLAAAAHYRLDGGGGTEIIVVEDAGGDDTAAWLRSRYPGDVRIVEHERNRGFCLACQSGFECARHPVVLLLNNDVRPRADCIAPLVEHFGDPGVFAVTGKMYNQKGDAFCNGGKIAEFRRGMWSGYLNYDVDAPVRDRSLLSFAAIGAFSAYDRERFLAIGGFDPLTAMYEDIEISYRAWKRGYLVRYEPRAVAYHDAGQTMKRRYRRGGGDVLARRSRIWMHWILLDDPGMFRRHLVSILARLATSWLWLDWPFYWAVATGLASLGAIRGKRRENRLKAKRTDRELFELLERFRKTAPITIRTV